MLDTAESFAEVASRPIKKVPTLRGKTVLNLFFEASTRTRSSFEIAEKRLSADNLNFSSSARRCIRGKPGRTALNLQRWNRPHRHPHAHPASAHAGRASKPASSRRRRRPQHPPRRARASPSASTKRSGLKVAIVGTSARGRAQQPPCSIARPECLAGGRDAVGSAFGVPGSTIERPAGADVVMMRPQSNACRGRCFAVKEYFKLSSSPLALQLQGRRAGMHPGRLTPRRDRSERRRRALGDPRAGHQLVAGAWGLYVLGRARGGVIT